jgi:LCP family protein required for cell wall assembly
MTDVTNHPARYRDKPLVELARELGFLVGAPIHYYAAVDLAGFRTLVDAVGGVTITTDQAVDDPTYAWLDGRRGFTLSAGTHALDGASALAYVRARSTTEDNDVGRSRRQQEVLLALLRKLTTPSMLPKIQQLVGLAGDTLRTNFPSDQISDMFDLESGIDTSSVTQIVLGPPYSVRLPGGQTDGIASFRLDLDQVATLSNTIFGSESTYPRQ